MKNYILQLYKIEQNLVKERQTKIEENKTGIVYEIKQKEMTPLNILFFVAYNIYSKETLLYI